MKLDPQKLLAQVGELQETLRGRLREIQAEAAAGGGMVRATCNAEGTLLRLHIDPEVVVPGEVELLEDLIRAAVNEARERAREAGQEEARRLLGGLPLPGGFGDLPV